MLKSILNLIGDELFPKQKIDQAIKRRDGATLAHLLATNDSIPDDYRLQSLSALVNLGAPGIKRLLLELRAGLYDLKDRAQEQEWEDSIAVRRRAAFCLEKVFPAAEKAGLAQAVIQSLALSALTERYEDPRWKAGEVLKSILPNVNDPNLITHLKLAADGFHINPEIDKERAQFKALVESLNSQNIQSEYISSPKQMLNVPVPEINDRYFWFELVEVNETHREKMSNTLRKAIQYSNQLKYEYAAREFESVEYDEDFSLLSDPSILKDLKGYALAEAGVMYIKLKDLEKACKKFVRVFETKRALVDSVHQAAGYLSVILDEAGRVEESALLSLQAGQTGAILGYHLKPEAEREVRELTRSYQPT